MYEVCVGNDGIKEESGKEISTYVAREVYAAVLGGEPNSENISLEDARKLIKEMCVFGSGVYVLEYAKEILEKAENGEYKSVEEVAKEIKDLKSEIAFYLNWD